MSHRAGLMLILIAALAVAATTMRAQEHAFIGTKKCKTCHLKEYKSWAETSMAQAFEALKAGERTASKKAAGLDPSKDYTTDATCLVCHTTGYGKKGGFVDIATTPDLAGVGCEMCHGPGGTYVADHLMSLKNKEYKKADVVAAGLVPAVSAAQCTTCHNAQSPFVGDDFVFDFAANKDKGTHEKFPLKYQH